MLRMPRAGGGMGVLGIAVTAAGLGGCAAGGRPAAPAVGSVNSEKSGAGEERIPPGTPSARADALYNDHFALRGSDARLTDDGQVAALRRAIVLYEQFIARAENDPRFDEAVRRSRDRIVDARATIEFLLQEEAETSAASP